MHADETKIGKIGKVSKVGELFNNIIKLAFMFHEYFLQEKNTKKVKEVLDKKHKIGNMAFLLQSWLTMRVLTLKV